MFVKVSMHFVYFIKEFTIHRFFLSERAFFLSAFGMLRQSNG